MNEQQGLFFIFSLLERVEPFWQKILKFTFRDIQFKSALPKLQSSGKERIYIKKVGTEIYTQFFLKFNNIPTSLY